MVTPRSSHSSGSFAFQSISRVVPSLWWSWWWMLLLSSRSLRTLHRDGTITTTMVVTGFTADGSRTARAGASTGRTNTRYAAPVRLEDNVDGVLYVNDRCIGCAACNMFAPATFRYSDRLRKFVVSRQPTLEEEDDASNDQLDRARAAMSACPVSAIRVERNDHSNNNKNNSQQFLSPQEERLSARFDELFHAPKSHPKNDDDDDRPFPRPVPGLEGVYYLGHHNAASFGAVPYLAVGRRTDTKVMVDTPKYSPRAIRAVESLTGVDGPDYLLLTHVDDCADHGKWRERFPNMQRIFHDGDLGEHNWIGDETLEEVEVLLSGVTTTTTTTSNTGQNTAVAFKAWTLDGEDVLLHDSSSRWCVGGDDTAADDLASEFLVVHTPGHSPGSISLLFEGSSPSTSEVAHDDDDDDVSSSAHRRRRHERTDHAIFTGDTYAFSVKENGMSGFPLYGNDLQRQAAVLTGLLRLRWDAVLPGHGSMRSYHHHHSSSSTNDDDKRREMEEAVGKLLLHAS